MKNRNESLLAAVCLFFVIFLAPFNLLMSFLLALALLSGFLAYRMMGKKMLIEPKATTKKKTKKSKSRRK